MLDPIAVSVDKMFELVQVGKISLREKRKAVPGRFALRPSLFVVRCSLMQIPRFARDDNPMKVLRATDD